MFASQSTLPRITVKVEDAALAEQGRVMKWEAVYEIEVAGTKTVVCAQQPRYTDPRLKSCSGCVHLWSPPLVPKVEDKRLVLSTLRPRSFEQHRGSQLAA